MNSIITSIIIPVKLFAYYGVMVIFYIVDSLSQLID